MGIRLPSIVIAKQFMNHRSSSVPKGYCAVYAGDDKRRFVIPVSYLNRLSFQKLLRKTEEEFGFHHPMGGLTIPCKEDIFIDIISHLDESL